MPFNVGNNHPDNRETIRRPYDGARAIKERYKAKLTQLEHDVKTGKLVHVDALQCVQRRTRGA